MDKYIIDKLVNFGLITNVGVDASKYEDVDDLINKGIITIPGAKAKIAELLNPSTTPLILVETTENEPVEVKVDEPAETTEPAETPETTEPVEVKVDEPVEVTEVAETTEPEIVVEETTEDNKKKSKKA